MKMIVVTTLKEAEAMCSLIDKHLGYPCMEQGEIGPPVLTERWALPTELANGKYGIIIDDRIEEALGKGIKTKNRAKEVLFEELKIDKSDIGLELPSSVEP